MNVDAGASAGGSNASRWRAPALPRRLLRLGPGERWFPDEIVEIEATFDDTTPAHVLVVHATRRRAGRGAVVSRAFQCVPAFACERDLAWWLRTLPSYDPEVEDNVVAWSTATAERIVAAMRDV